MFMDLPEAREAIYILQRQHRQMEACGVDVNAGLTNHADLLDRNRGRSEGLQLSTGVNVKKFKDGIESLVGTVEFDMRRVRDEDKAADAQPRVEVDALRASLSAGHDQLTISVAALYSAFGEMQGTGPASRPPPAPGFDTLAAFAAQVIGLDSELRNEKGRTDHLGSATEEQGQRFQQFSLAVSELQTEARRSAEAAASTAQGAVPDPWHQARQSSAA